MLYEYVIYKELGGAVGKETKDMNPFDMNTHIVLVPWVSTNIHSIRAYIAAIVWLPVAGECPCKQPSEMSDVSQELINWYVRLS